MTVAHLVQTRPSQINALLEKARKKSYDKYLVRVKLVRLRGFEDKSINFDFPVTALVGPNGGGKTTVLGAAACAYKSIAPRRFFAKSGPLDASMTDWSIEYELVDRSVSATDSFKRTTSFRQLKWSRDASDREVAVFGVSRTVPATERTEMVRYASTKFSFKPEARVQIPAAAAKAISRILGKDVSRYTEIAIGSFGQLKLLSGQTDAGIEYSEFHFGAGESSIVRMVVTIETLPENSLVLIEEIENGLHPVATRKMVEYLIDVADRKRIQTIFTTHSNDALAPLPDQAIWAATNSEVFQGKLDVQSLRAITGQIDRALAVFVEDAFAKVWIEAILRTDSTSFLINQVEVHGLNGDGTAVAVNRHHNVDPSARVPSICFIDGDSKQRDNAPEHVHRLPGASPEGYVYDTVLENWDRIGGRLTVALLQPFDKTAEVRTRLMQVRRDIHDEHVLFSAVGEALGFIPEETVRQAFLAFWCECDASESARVLGIVSRRLSDRKPT